MWRQLGRGRYELGHRSVNAAKVDSVTLPELPEPLPAPVVDSHCHLDVTEAVSGLSPAEAVEKARRVGVTRIVQIGCDVQGSRWAVSAAERWPNVIAGVAIHPNDAARLGRNWQANWQSSSG